MPRTLILLAVALPLAALSAQVPAPDSGARVRVRFTEAGTSRRVTGTLAFRDEDSITVVTDRVAATAPATGMSGPRPPQRSQRSRRVSIPRVDISSVQVSAGRHSSAGTGALIGAGVGVAGGVTVGVLALCGNSGDFICFDNGGEVALFAGITGAGCAAIGALVGALVTHENWVTVNDRANWSLILAPRSQGTAAGLSIRF
jgi:hypothetical protein